MDNLVFEMGLYKATFPRSLSYSPMHFWFKTEGNATRFGLSAYANRLLADLFRIDWKVVTGQQLEYEQPLGEIESTKAVSELYAPLEGILLHLNDSVVQEPSVVSVDPYAAWLMEVDRPPAAPLTAEQYVAFLAEGWDETVKLLKGQM